MRYVLLVHRYLAVCIGLLMVLWCLSGFVMMYQSFPELSAEQRLAGLAPLELAGCCNTALVQDDAAATAPPFRIEMLLGAPVLRTGGAILNLRTGQPVAQLSDEQVLAVARQYAEGNGITGTPRSLGVIAVDQWTIQSAGRNRPVHHIAFADGAATEIYVNGSTGEVFQTTNRRIRVLSWLGAVPHWLYPRLLRQNAALWTEIVIWTSVAGSFLAATGLYVGISRIRRNPRNGQLASPYRGWWYWHHVSGLLFGVLALTWVFSGLMTMNPWGTLSGGGGSNYRTQLAGNASWGELQQFLAALGKLPATGGYKQLQSAPFDQRLYVLALRDAAGPLRLDVEGRLAQLTEGEVQRAVAGLTTPVREFAVMADEDLYYYGHKREVSLPVYRVLLDDAGQTRLYIDRDSGSVRSIGASGRVSRWIRTGLHGLDFPGLRLRPVWDVVTLLLLAGVTALCMIGSWLAIRRVRMDVRLLRARWHRTRAAGGQPGAEAVRP